MVRRDTCPENAPTPRLVEEEAEEEGDPSHASSAGKKATCPGNAPILRHPVGGEEAGDPASSVGRRGTWPESVLPMPMMEAATRGRS